MADSGLNSTAAALLGLLHESPMTGGQLMSAAQRRLGPFWSMTRSQVYRELPALAGAGYVKLGRPGARSSQPYAITPAGKRAFVRWLAETPGRDVLRSPLALRVAFGGHQSAAQLQQAYSQAGEYHAAAMNEARDQAKVARTEGDEFGAASLELAVAYHKAVIAWLKAAPSK